MGLRRLLIDRRCLLMRSRGCRIRLRCLLISRRRLLMTGRETVIGIIQVRDSPGYIGYGRLTGKGVNVLEYYGQAHMEDCTGLPTVVLAWRGPFADERRMRAKEVYFSYPAKAECTNNNAVSPGTGQVEQRAGGQTQRVTPEGKRVNWPQILEESMPH
ncbi:MAG: hypothetical protein HQL87_17975 [Magnetococcales bacterium]|nr:hypothetical protein [Magnetococcales bacterium]